MPLPDGFEDVKEDSARTITRQIWQATMTTEGKEMIMAVGLVSLEMDRHAPMVAWNFCVPTHAQKARMNGAPGTRHPKVRAFPLMRKECA